MRSVSINSPAAAASRWVNEEIRYFAGLGRETRIFLVIVDGEPAADGSVSGCFPGKLREIGIEEPLAADARKWADGKKLARLKLVAGMLGLPLDQLRRRDLQKRQKLWVLAFLVSVAVTAMLIVAITSRIAAQQRRDSGESLVAYKLNELRTLLNVANDPEALSGLDRWDTPSLAKLSQDAGAGQQAMFSSAMEKRKQGITFWKKSELREALMQFEQSWALFAMDFRRDSSKLQVFFELGQAEYWIGRVYWDQGDLDRAEEKFMNYAEITRRLILQQPENAQWVLEMAYALTNLGSIQTARDSNNPQRLLQLMQSALEYNQIALVLDPDNPDYRMELGQSHANLASAQLGVCDLEGALQSRQENVLLETELMQEDTEDPGIKRRLAFALYGYAKIQELLGNIDAAMDSHNQSLQLLEAVLVENPGVERTVRRILERKQRIVRLLALDGKIEEAWAASVDLAERWQNFHQGKNSDEIGTTRAYLASINDRAMLARDMGDTAMAQRLLGYVVERLANLLRAQPGNRAVGNMLVQAVFHQWEITGDLPVTGVAGLLPDYGDDNDHSRSCIDAASEFSRHIMYGDLQRAAGLADYLVDNGYREPAFMRRCVSHGLCPRQ